MMILSVDFKALHAALFFLFLISFSVESQKEEIPFYKSYIAYHTNDQIEVDGKGDENSWNKVAWSSDFIDIEGIEKPLYRTRMKMLWDENYLYFYAEMEEPHIWGDITERDAVIFYNNDFEVFIDATGDTHNYYEFEMNSLNTVWDLFLTKPYRNHGVVLNNWDINGLKSAVSIDGTINDPSDVDKKWSIEIAMPWDVLIEAAASKEIPKGKNWRINFSRVNWNFDIIDGKYQRKKDKNTGKYLPEYNWVWSPQGVINMHEPEKWGYVLFSEKRAGENDTFFYGDDESIKHRLYSFYREQLEYLKKNNSWNEKLIPESIEVKENTIPIIVENQGIGSSISVVSPFTGKRLLLREDGKLIIK